tara:strand:+ start:10459 stop:10749 length:291 start_codon:yes stop_codon:yes gene_type:complete
MKINKEQLRQIIAEELSTLSEMEAFDKSAEVKAIRTGDSAGKQAAAVSSMATQEAEVNGKLRKLSGILAQRGTAKGLSRINRLLDQALQVAGAEPE